MRVCLRSSDGARVRGECGFLGGFYAFFSVGVVFAAASIVDDAAPLLNTLLNTLVRLNSTAVLV
jgi:hypothetical protein